MKPTKRDRNVVIDFCSRCGRIKQHGVWVLKEKHVMKILKKITKLNHTRCPDCCKISSYAGGKA